MTEKPRFVKAPEFTVTKREGMSLLYVTGVFGGLAPNDGRMLFFTDRLEVVPAEVPGTQKVKMINQEIQSEIHMSPATFKSIAVWMMNHINNYEKTFGEIQVGPKKQYEGTDKGYIK